MCGVYNLLYIIIFVLECTWHYRDSIIQGDGERIYCQGQKFCQNKWLSECEKICEDTYKCVSFGFCPQYSIFPMGRGSCYLSSKALTGNEPLTVGPNCYTVYGLCTGNNLKN